jgi:oligopeptide transport system substrate-binding protein
MLKNGSFGLFLLFMVLFSSCQKKEPSPVKQKVLHINVHQEPVTMDPRKGSDWISTVMHFNLFEGLMRCNPDGSLTPAQAESVDISPDHLVYTFHLRDTVWSNGDPVTAQDFEMSWKKILSPEFPSPNAHLLYPIKNAERMKKGELSSEAVGIYVPDDKTLVVILEHPTPYFLNLVAFSVFYPVSHKIDINDSNWALEAGPSFVCNGAFSLGSWKHHNEVIFQKNPLYWNKKEIALDQIHVSMIADSNTALQMFENGALDILGLGISPIPPDALLKYAAKGLLHLNHFPGTTIICFNVDKFPFHNLHIRKAFALALDRKEVVENIVNSEGELAISFIPPGLKLGISLSFLDNCNLFLSKQHLAAGLKELGLSLEEFPPITYSYTSTGNNHALAQAVQQQLSHNLGITVNLDKSDYKTHMDKLSARTYELIQHFWVAQYNDPMNILERFKYKTNTKNYPGWENATFIQLLNKSVLDSTPEKRAQTLELAEALLLEELPLVPLYHWASAFITQPYVSGYETSANGAFDYSHLHLGAH